MASASFKINGVDYSAGKDVGPHVTLNDFIRNYANLKGTKKMCAEGGCGCCVVFVEYKDPSDHKTISRSINSCMMPIYACDGWKITTIEGIGNRHKGYHCIQKRLAKYNGTQCGFCSPGFVMNMYGVLAKNPKPTKQQIENSFDGNICRCTGYRSILDAMKSFSEPGSCVPDIEEINKACCGKRGFMACNNSCKTVEEHKNLDDFVLVSNTPTKGLNIGKWNKPETLEECLKMLEQIGDKKIRMVVGNTGSGVFKHDGPYDHFIDIRRIPELHKINKTDAELKFGAAVTLSTLIEVLQEKAGGANPVKQFSVWDYFSSEANTSNPWEFCDVLAYHISHVGNTPVRNAASWAGNLMMKHDHNNFTSDIFTIMETAGATLTIGSADGSMKDGIVPSKFIRMNMKKKMILALTLKKFNANDIMRTFRITVRSQSSPAYINAGFKFEISKSENFKVVSKPSIVFGGVNKDFAHATKTEAFLTRVELANSEIVQKALKTLESEIKPDDVQRRSSVTYRTSLCCSLLYKFILGVIGPKAATQYQLGGNYLERPLSSGHQIYYTDEDDWPLTEKVPKIEALIQCAGEAQYTVDIGERAGQLYGAFVLSSKANATLKSIDTKEALAVAGIVKVIVAKDIPGTNSFFGDDPEEILASKKVNYHGQPIAIVLAETEYLAEKGVSLIKAEYTDVKPPIVNIKDAIEKKSFWGSEWEDEVVAGDVSDGFTESDRVFEGELGLGSQYHFHMETQACVCVPTDIGLDVYSSTQSSTAVQRAIARTIKMDENEVNMIVKRLGGGFGGKLSRSLLIATGCAVSAHLTNRPVRIRLPLETNMRMVGKRLPYFVKYKVGVTNAGKLKAVKIVYYDDSGSSPNGETGSTVTSLGDSGYYCKNWKLKAIAVKTNTPANCSCRAPAWLQGATFIEGVLEDVAYNLGLEPINVKAMNLIKDGQETASGDTIFNCHLHKMVSTFREMSNFDVRRSSIREFNKVNTWKKKGLSCVFMRFPHSYYDVNFNSMVSIYSDGTVSVSHGGVEMGQGINTKAAQVCAYVFGISLSYVKIKPTTSLIAPNNSETGGSIGSDLVAFATMRACQTLKKRMKPFEEDLDEDSSWIDLVESCLENNIDLCVRNTYTEDDVPKGYNVYGMTATEIELDVLTGMIQIPRVDILYDGGDSMSPDIDIGQIEGAFVMGLGMMLSEKIKYDTDSGELLTKSTSGYSPPTTKDIPIKFNIQFLKDVRNPLGVLGSKATGEPPLCMTGSALFAIRDAIQSARADAGDTKRVFITAPATPEYNHDASNITVERMKI